MSKYWYFNVFTEQYWLKINKKTNFNNIKLRFQMKHSTNNWIHNVKNTHTLCARDTKNSKSPNVGKWTPCMTHHIWKKKDGVDFQTPIVAGPKIILFEWLSIIFIIKCASFFSPYSSASQIFNSIKTSSKHSSQNKTQEKKRFSP